MEEQNQAVILTDRTVHGFTGFGKYKYITEASYEGDWVNGLCHGHGLFKEQDGSYYEGDWANGRQDGNGRQESAKGGYTYEGGWAKGRFHGEGTQTFTQNPLNCDDWTYVPYEKNEIYQGTWVNGKREGEFLHVKDGLFLREFYVKGNRIPLRYGGGVQDEREKGCPMGHAGFWLQTDQATFLFDTITGVIPPVREGSPLYVFVSSPRREHFCDAVFDLSKVVPDVYFILSGELLQEGYSQEEIERDYEIPGRVFFVQGGETLTIGDTRIEVLSGIKEGVAFLVEQGGKSFFHSGRLILEGEKETEDAISQYASPLVGREITFAMLGFDPRFGENGWQVSAFCLEHAQVKSYTPIMYWDKPEYLEDFVEKYPDLGKAMVIPPIRGQQYRKGNPDSFDGAYMFCL